MHSRAITHGFPESEFAARCTRAQALMRDYGFDALVVTTPANVRYFTGFDTQFWESPTRPWFVIVPAAAKPLAVVPEIGAQQMAETWVDDVRSWPAPQPEDDGTTLLADALATQPRRFGRVGFELGREMTLRMPVMQFLELRERLGGIELADGSPCLWAIRTIKTEAEIAKIAHVCRLASAAYAALPKIASAGMTERAVAQKLRIDLLARGADAVPFLPVISGPGGVAQILCGPGDRILTEGDVLFIDTGTVFDGYFCDFDRTFAVGALDDAAKRAQEAVWQATAAGIAAAVPGARCVDLFHAMASRLAGVAGGNVGRMGHGLGMQLTEPPSHRLGDTTEIMPGMVLTIEPGLEYAPGRMIVHEENVAITSDGPVLLTARAPREMPIID